MTPWIAGQYRRLLLLAGLALAAGFVMAMRNGTFAVSDMQRMRARGAVFVMNDYGEVIEVRLDGPSFHDVDLLRLTAFPTLEYLSVKDSRVTDAGIALLPVLSRLQRMNLSGTSVTVTGLGSIATYPSLWELDLRNCPRLSSQDLLVLSKSTSISTLYFDWRKLREEDYVTLKHAYGVLVPSPQELFPAFPGGLKNEFPNISVDLDRASHYFSLGQDYWKSNLPEIPYAHLFTHASVDGTVKQDDGFRLSPRLARRMQLVTHLFPGIQVLSLRQPIDADLVHVKDLPQLNELSILGSKQYTAAGLRALQDIAKLNSLTVEAVEFPDERDIDYYWKDFTNAQAGLDESVLPVLAGIEGLQTLHVNLLWSGRPLVKWLGNAAPSRCTELKLEVETPNGNFHDGDDIVLGALPVLFPNLRKLTYSFAGQMDLAPLARLQHLEVLRLKCAHTPSIVGLAGHPALRLLELKSALVGLKRQSQIYVPITKWSATDLEALGSCPQLNVIQLPVDFVPDLPLNELERILQMQYPYPDTDPLDPDSIYVTFHRGEVNYRLYE